MMKVGLLHYDFTPYTTSLADALAQYTDLTLIHPVKLSHATEPVLDSRIQVHNFVKPRARYPHNLLTVWRLLRFIQSLHLDVLHVQATGDPWFEAILPFAKLPPIVTTVHDVTTHPGDKSSVPGSQYTRRISFHYSQQLIVHAQTLKEFLTQVEHIPSERISVLPHGELGTYYDRWATKSVVARETHSLLFFGRIWPYKGLHVLLEALPLVTAQFPNVRLIIAGRGENIDRYFPHGVDPDRYEIINCFVPLEDVAGLFRRSTIAVLPYIEASQSGVAALAFAMGTPVIASYVGGLAEMIQDTEDGLLVPPGDASALARAIIRLLADPIMQDQIRSRATARCQTDLSWDSIAKQTIDVYEKTRGQSD